MLNWIKAAVVVSGTLFSAGAIAQPFPSKPITLVVTSGPGSGADILSRVVGEGLGRRLGQPVVIENRPGAGGNIAAEVVARASADGYTLLMASTSTHGTSTSLYKTLRFDPIKDFSPVGLVAANPNVLVVSSSSPVKSVKDLIALAKEKPGGLTYSSGGNGTSQHLAGEVFTSMTGTKLLHVPYRAAPPALSAVLAGDVTMTFASVPVALAQAKTGAVRALGVTSGKPVTVWPDMPTLSSQGLQGFDVSAWFGIAAPANTPQPVVAKLNTTLQEVLAEPALRQKLQDLGIEVIGGTPAQFDAYIRSELDRWGTVIRASGVKIE